MDWRAVKLEWTWTVDFKLETLMGQKQDRVGKTWKLDDLKVGCFDDGTQVFPVLDLGHIIQQSQPVVKDDEACCCGQGSCGGAVSMVNA